MRIKLIIIQLLFAQLHGYSQNHWYPEGDAEYNTIDTVVAAFYNDSTNNILYVGGRFNHLGGVPANHIAYWDGVSWNTMGSGIDTGGLVGVNAICQYNGEIYATGTFRSFNNVIYNNVARWDGSSWLPLSGGLHGNTVPTVFDMCVYNGLLYFVGRFDSAGTVPASGVAAWDGTNWHPLGNSTVSIFWPQSCIVHDSTLVMGGVFTNVDTGSGILNAPRVVGWNSYDDQWVTYGNIGGLVNDLVEFHGEIYAGGSFQNANGNNISKWNGNTWTPLGSGLDNYVRALCVYEDSLVAGGGFRHASSLTVNFIAMWDGASWVNLDSGFSSPTAFLPDVAGCIQFGDRIYAGGLFSYASTTKCAKLAVWPHSPLIVADPSFAQNQFSVSPNPFSELITINYTVVDNGPIEIRILDVLGNIVSTPLSEQQSTIGSFSLLLNADALCIVAGMYFFEIITEHSHTVQKVIFQNSK